MNRFTQAALALPPFLLMAGASLLAATPASQPEAEACPPSYEGLARSALQGDVRSISKLTPCYASARERALSLSEAAHFVRAAAERGLAEAQFVWGMMLLTGDGATEDTAEALLWIQRAAAQGHEQARQLFEYMLNHDEPLAC
jgi:TPR repeat protein